MAGFQDRLKEIRLAKRLSQKELAAILSVSEKTISHYETGYCEPNMDIIEKLCNFFEVSAGYLLG